MRRAIKSDKEVKRLIRLEEKRQLTGIELIPSENYASPQVRQALASCFSNKYSEGYPGRRYYGGNEIVDELERLAQERTKKIFGVPYANVQPYSGSPANLAVYLATCRPGDVVMGQALSAGGHLTHGHSVSATGIYYKSVQYTICKEKQSDGGLFDFNFISQLAKEYRPKLIWVGATAYPLKINFSAFAQIAADVGAYLAADISHIAGLIVGGMHPSPVTDAHIITTTTHKTLRGPRGAIIMVTEKGFEKDPDLGKKIDKAVFPGLQGGPHDQTTAAIAIALFEAMQPIFKVYARQVVNNSKRLASVLINGGLSLIGNGSENHLILVDLTPTHGKGNGILAEKALDLVGLTLNKNTVPGELSSPFYPSGIRLGTAAVTTRGMGEQEMKNIGEVILQVLEMIKGESLPVDKVKRLDCIKNFCDNLSKNPVIGSLRLKIKKLALRFPPP